MREWSNIRPSKGLCLKLCFQQMRGGHILSMTGFLEYWSCRRAILAIFFLTVKGYCYCWWILFPTLNSMMRHFISHWTPVSHIATCWGERGKKKFIFSSVQDLPTQERQKKTYFMLVLSARLKIHIVACIFLCIFLVQILKETHW